MSTKVPICLSIAGSDSGGNAGIQADLRTFSALNTHGTSVITCMTAQNPELVKEVIPSPASFVESQLSTVLEYYDIQAIKTGMLFDAEIIHAISKILVDYKSIPLIVDPVMMSSSGAPLLKEDAIQALESKILPLASLITPNLDEAELLSGQRAQNPDQMENIARTLAENCGSSVLLKGGHLPGNALVDVLYQNGRETIFIENERICTTNTHGSGCTLSAAITAYVAGGLSIDDAVDKAITWLNKAIQSPLELSSDFFINHIHNTLK